MPKQPEQNEELAKANKTGKKHLPKEMEPFLFKKGQSGNPKGRPKGISIKDRVRQWLETHPDDMKGFVMHFVKDNRDLAWQMLEGRPSTALDITTGGNPFDDETRIIAKSAVSEYLKNGNETRAITGKGG